MSDQDEFDEYDFSEFTDQDLREIDAHLARKHSLFNTFLSSKKYFAVTDLVSPTWCEVQYEYSLYGKCNKPFHLRPSTFTSKTGKHIRVHQQVAHANDRRLKRGKSIHKALEKELRPEKFVVHVISDEERFGLRLVQLIDGFTQLVSDGITRELPVFTITHAQVVLGIIDEVLRLPITSPAPPSTSAAPPPHKKQRLLSSPSAIPGDPYELRILDYKTRRSSKIPVDQDSLSPRLQLMMYHRMLSSLLQPEAFDFHLLWNRLNLDPTKSFSPQFLKDIVWEQRRVDPTDCNVHLNRLVSQWITTVQRQRPQIIGVSRQLQLVYRRSVFAGVHKAQEPVDIEDPLEALVLQEELDLARAIEESLSQMGHQQVGQVAHHVAQNVMQVGPSSLDRTSAIWKDLVSPLVSEQSDPTLAWAIQQSLLTCAHKACAEAPANKLQNTDINQDNFASDEPKSAMTPPQDGDTVDISPIIGTREFSMDDDELDAHLTDVLQWWFGARPARGVDVGQTNRCFTCEYQDSCEWRERKAKEALAVASERREQRSSTNSIWPTTRPEVA